MLEVSEMRTGAQMSHVLLRTRRFWMAYGVSLLGGEGDLAPLPLH